MEEEEDLPKPSQKRDIGVLGPLLKTKKEKWTCFRKGRREEKCKKKKNTKNLYFVLFIYFLAGFEEKDSDLLWWIAFKQAEIEFEAYWEWVELFSQRGTIQKERKNLFLFFLFISFSYFSFCLQAGMGVLYSKRLNTKRKKRSSSLRFFSFSSLLFFSSPFYCF